LCKFFEFTYDPSHNSMLAAFGVSQIRRRWRETAISFQRLWSAIQLSTGSSAAHDLCVSRAGNSLLYVAIKIHWGGGWEPSIVENIRRFAQHRERMVFIDIEAPDSSRYFLDNLDFAAHG